MNEEKNVTQRRKGAKVKTEDEICTAVATTTKKGIATGMLFSFHQSPFTLFPLRLGVSFKFQ
jgi:hypothetical protein